MSFEDNLPQSPSEIFEKSKTDIQRALSVINNENAVNAFLEGDWISALPGAQANRIYDFILQLIEAKKQNFPHTAEDENADAWGSIYLNDGRNVSKGAEGLASITGTIAASVPASTSYQNTDGVNYEVVTGGAIASNALALVSLTRLGLFAEGTTSTPHFLSSNIQVTITGAADAIYNGVFDIFVESETKFSYQLPAGPALPDAGGAPIANFTSGVIELKATPPTGPSEVFEGKKTNLLLNAPLALQVTIPGINNTANAIFGGFTGGSNEENNFDFRERYLDKIRNPIAHFNDSDIESIVRINITYIKNIFIQNAGEKTGAQESILGLVAMDNIFGEKFANASLSTESNFFSGAEITITGAGEPQYNVINEKILLIDNTNFIYKIAGDPASPATGLPIVNSIVSLGHTIIYFTTTDPGNPIPSPAQLAEVKDIILTISPVGTPDSFIEVLAPTLDVIDFTLQNIIPNTASMRTAIVENLTQFFEENATVGGIVNENLYNVAISNTVDPLNGDKVSSFDIISPVGNIIPGVGLLPTFGQLL